MLTMECLMPRVLKGASWLDEAKSGWYSAVDIDVLRLEDCARCVLGQLFGNFHRVRLASNSLSETQWAVENGFALCGPDDLWAGTYGKSPAWPLLRECWVTVILERRFKEQCSLPTPAPTQDAVACPALP